MHPEIAGILAEQHQHELIRRAESRHVAASLRGPRRPAPRRRAPRWRAPRYRVHWTRTTLSPVDAAGAPVRRERSWVIVISASRGL
jgi:hypothetical protein